MKRQIRLLFIIVILALTAVLITAVSAETITRPDVPLDPPTILLHGQQGILVQCDGDTLIIEPFGDTEALVTCRVWVAPDSGDVIGGGQD